MWLHGCVNMDRGMDGCRWIDGMKDECGSKDGGSG